MTVGGASEVFEGVHQRGADAQAPDRPGTFAGEGQSKQRTNSFYCKWRQPR